MSAVLLITPLMLATAAPVFAVQAPVYSHATQTALGATLASSTMYCSNTNTFNGTQTFTASGKPFDSDSDSDQQGDC